MSFFNDDLKQEIERERKKLEGRLHLLKDVLSNPDLDDRLREEIAGKVTRLKRHLETRIHKIANGRIPES